LLQSTNESLGNNKQRNMLLSSCQYEEIDILAGLPFLIPKTVFIHHFITASKINPSGILYNLAARVEIDAQMAQIFKIQTQGQPRSRHLPAPFFTPPNFSYVNIAPQQHNERSVIDSFAFTWTHKPSANYFDRLTYVLLNHLQEDIQTYPEWKNGDMFSPAKLELRQIYTAQIGNHQQL
jgi:hypothetical protein